MASIVSTTIVSKETYYSVKRDLLQCQKRPTTGVSSLMASIVSTTTVSKETYYRVKRDLLQCQKRPTTVSKETYYRSVVIDGVDSLHHCSKSSLQVQESLRYAKTGKSVKRDLILSQKRPT
jgi:hypothetical protein